MRNANHGKKEYDLDAGVGADADDSGGQVADSLVSEPDVDPAECSRHYF